MATNLIRFDPFSTLDAMRHELFDDDLRRMLRPAALPTTDVFTEDDRTLVIEAHLPRFTEDDIEISIDGGHLIIQAERREKDQEKAEKHRRYVVRESSSSFYRSLELPENTVESGITAAFADGLLTIRVPLARSTEPRKVAISPGG